MEKLPTRLKIQIRDEINSEKSPLAEAVAKVTTVLGYSVIYDPEWSMLWATLKPHYPDQATFIPSIAQTLIAWCEYFTTWLEDEENETVVDNLLEELKGAGRLKLVLETESKAAASKPPRPTSAYRPKDKVFTITLPLSPLPPISFITSGFASDFSNLFPSSPELQAQADESASSAKAAPLPPAGDDWSLLDSPDMRPQRRQAQGGHRGGLNEEAEAPEPLPNLAMLERPEVLLNRPPYRMLVRQDGSGRVEVQGSHSASLVLLETYLKKWVKHSNVIVNQPPLADIKLGESVFGLGLMFDSLVIETEVRRGNTVNAGLVLAMIENVLGYEMLIDRGSSGYTWEFERRRGFK